MLIYAVYGLRLPPFPLVPLVPMVLMRCSLQMVYHWTEEISIHTNGANRKASLTNGDSFYQWYYWWGFLDDWSLCILDVWKNGHLSPIHLPSFAMRNYYIWSYANLMSLPSKYKETLNERIWLTQITLTYPALDNFQRGTSYNLSVIGQEGLYHLKQSYIFPFNILQRQYFHKCFPTLYQIRSHTKSNACPNP